VKPLTLAVFLIVAAALSPAAPPDPLPEARALMRDNRYAEAAKLFEPYLAGNRFDGRAWADLGYCLHAEKQYDAAIAAARKAIECGFNPGGQMYNIACASALTRRPDQALDWLRQAFENGFVDHETLESDEDLTTLRSDPRFIRLTGLSPPAEPSAEKRWAWDLDFLARRMEQMHWDLYAKVPKAKFVAELKQLATDAPALSPDRARARLSRILALVGDGHTTLAAFADGETSIARVPLHLYQFTDGLFIMGAADAHRDLVGSKVIKVGRLDADEALQRARAYCSVDNAMGYLEVAPARLVHPSVLQDIGATDGGDVEYTIKPSAGPERTVKIALAPVERSALHGSRVFRPGFVYANAGSPAPLYLRNLDKPLTMESLPDHKAVYFGFHAVAENKGQRFGEFIKQLMQRIDDTKAESLIIDMRLNGGGNTGLVQPLLEAIIRNDRINRPGHLFVIIGRGTFSAAQNTVNLLENYTRATFVGEPTGSRPNFVGESTYIVLPYSKLRVYCSSRYWQHAVSTDKRNWVPPQIVAELSSADFAANRDPCLEAVFARLSNAEAAGGK